MNFLSSSLEIAQRQLCDSNVQKNDRLFKPKIVEYITLSNPSRSCKASGMSESELVLQ
jgi:hypothetical protein